MLQLMKKLVSINRFWYVIFAVIGFFLFCILFFIVYYIIKFYQGRELRARRKQREKEEKQRKKEYNEQHYGYMSGGMGQRVRVYRSVSGDRSVSISYAHNGMQVGRDYYTDQGAITKYL